jgi:hypothetical protein
MWHVRIDSPPWGPDTALKRLDDTLAQLHSSMIDVGLGTFPLERDGEHFTKNGQRAFHEALSDALQHVGEDVLIIADSTIDFHNWSHDWEWTGWASSSLKKTLSSYGVTNAIVDAVCGSGFIARARQGEHFYARLSHHLRTGYRGPVVFIGGWNDVRNGRVDDTLDAIRKCASLVERYHGIA